MGPSFQASLNHLIPKKLSETTFILKSKYDCCPTSFTKETSTTLYYYTVVQTKTTLVKTSLLSLV